MASLNEVLLIGNLTSDPELKQVGSDGKSVCNFSIAVNRPYVKDKKEGVTDVDFINIVSWGKQAEFVCAYFSKGDPMYIRGRLQTRSWTDDQQNKRYAVEIFADEISFVRAKSKDEAKEGATENFQ